MTCIIGLVEEGTVYIGGDSLATSGYILQTLASPKVFRLADDWIIGYSGSVRMANLLQYALKPPEHPEEMSVEQYLTTHFVNALRTLLKEAGVASKQNEQESTIGSFLVGYRGGLYKIGSDYSTMAAADGFDAVGSGLEPALGAMHATRRLHLDPRYRIALALEAASDLCHGVRDPFVIEELKGRMNAK